MRKHKILLLKSVVFILIKILINPYITTIIWFFFRKFHVMFDNKKIDFFPLSYLSFHHFIPPFLYLKLTMSTF